MARGEQFTSSPSVQLCELSAWGFFWLGTLVRLTNTPYHLRRPYEFYNKVLPQIGGLVTLDRFFDASSNKLASQGCCNPSPNATSKTCFHGVAECVYVRLYMRDKMLSSSTYAPTVRNPLHPTPALRMWTQVRSLFPAPIITRPE